MAPPPLWQVGVGSIHDWQATPLGPPQPPPFRPPSLTAPACPPPSPCSGLPPLPVPSCPCPVCPRRLLSPAPPALQHSSLCPPASASLSPLPCVAALRLLLGPPDHGRSRRGPLPLQVRPSCACSRRLFLMQPSFPRCSAGFGVAAQVTGVGQVFMRSNRDDG